MMYSGDEYYDDEITSGGDYPKAITHEPSIRLCEMWADEGFAQATDGCIVEPDGECEHGHPSWLISLGFI